MLKVLYLYLPYCRGRYVHSSCLLKFLIQRFIFSLSLSLSLSLCLCVKVFHFFLKFWVYYYFIYGLERELILWWWSCRSRYDDRKLWFCESLGKLEKLRLQNWDLDLRYNALNFVKKKKKRKWSIEVVNSSKRKKEKGYLISFPLFSLFCCFVFILYCTFGVWCRCRL